MNINVRHYQPETDYPLFEQWWKTHNWQPVAADMLPKLGVVTEIDGRPAACVWCYMDNSASLAMIEWVVANPENTHKESYIAITHSLQCAKKIVSGSFGYKYFMAATSNKSLMKIFSRCGFTATDTDITHFVLTEEV